jgi:citrate lyase beta subunit
MPLPTFVHSLLFVPGDRPDRLEKALASEASLICIDLEDAVAPRDKAAARERAMSLVRNGLPSRATLRLNALSTRDGLADLLALADALTGPAVILLPKIGQAAEIALFDKIVGDLDVRLITIVESCEGVANAFRIAQAPRVEALIFGGGDLSAELGVRLEWEPLVHARASVVMAAAGAEIGAIDVPFLDIEDETGLREECIRSKTLGFSGKVAIHPRQVTIINECFRPSEDELIEARAALAAFDQAGRSAMRHNGKMLEAPIVRRYERMIAAAAAEPALS